MACGAIRPWGDKEISRFHYIGRPYWPVGQSPLRIEVGQLRAERAKHGLYRALIANMVLGVTKGYEKRLEIQGVGFRALMAGKRLQLFVGYNTKVPNVYDIPDDVKVDLPTQTQIVISGIDKQLVGQVAADIRGFCPPEPYKGKGIHYVGEQIRRKQGKKVG